MPHKWATPHPTKFRNTLLSYAALFRLLFILWLERFVQLLCIFWWIFEYFIFVTLHWKWTTYNNEHLWLIPHLMFFLLVIIRQAIYSFTYVSIVLFWQFFFSNILSTSPSLDFHALYLGQFLGVPIIAQISYVNTFHLVSLMRSDPEVPYKTFDWLFGSNSAYTFN